MASRAYLKLLEEKAKCTVNYCGGNIFEGTNPMAIEQRVDFLINRLAKFKVRGYSREYITQLVKEDKELRR